MNATAEQPLSKHPDGFSGCRDERILLDYADETTAVSGVVFVQAVARTRDLLRRAGYKRVCTHHHYPVKVTKTEFRKLQLAAPGTSAMTSFLLIETEDERRLRFEDETAALTQAHREADRIIPILVKRLRASVSHPSHPRRMNNLISAFWTYLQSRSPRAMNTTAPMKTAVLTHAQQSAILAKFPFADDGRMRVTATHRTEPLLKLAGITHPRPLESYLIRVKQDAKGFTIVDCQDGRPLPVGESDDELFQPGGLLHGMDPETLLPAPAVSERSETVSRADLSGICEISRTRTFEIPNGSHSKIRIQVLAFEDTAFPTPQEPECWEPQKPTEGDIRAAVLALSAARDVRAFEQL